MLLVGCAIAFLVALAPRVVLVLAAIFSERWDVVWLARPDGWICDPAWYGAGDGCDCGCGEFDSEPG